MIKFDLRQKGKINIKTDLTPVMKQIAQIMKRSVQLNFERGGRPNAWLPLKRGSGTPLMGQGTLYRTIRSDSDKNSALVASGAGLPYWRIHHKGGMAGRGHKASIPARPYMVLQREDIVKIAKMIGTFTIQGVKGEDAIF